MEHRTDTFQQHRQVSHDDISLDELEMSLPCKPGQVLGSHRVTGGGPSINSSHQPTLSEQ